MQAFADLQDALGLSSTQLLANKALLTSIIRYHVTSAVLTTPGSLLAAGKLVTQMSNKPIMASGYDACTCI